jgi:hypothetical protein
MRSGHGGFRYDSAVREHHLDWFVTYAEFLHRKCPERVASAFDAPESRGGVACSCWTGALEGAPPRETALEEANAARRAGMPERRLWTGDVQPRPGATVVLNSEWLAPDRGGDDRKPGGGQSLVVQGLLSRLRKRQLQFPGAL